MDILDIIPIVISSISLVVAGASLYLSQFRKPKIVVRLGPDIHLYHPADGGTGLYLPMLFTNDSPTRGAVLQIFLELTAPNGKHYFLKWQEEAEIELRTWKYSHKVRAKPFTVDGYSTVVKVFWFLCPENSEPLLFKAGTYGVRAHLWTEATANPGVITENKLNILPEFEREMRRRFEAKDPQTRFLYFEDKTLIASVSTTSEGPWKDSPLVP